MDGVAPTWNILDQILAAESDVLGLQGLEDSVGRFHERPGAHALAGLPAIFLETRLEAFVPRDARPELIFY